MKLKFELKQSNLDQLLKVLTHVYQTYWDGKESDDKTLLYFDNDTLLIFPIEQAGFDRIYARVVISQVKEHFFSSYTI